MTEQDWLASEDPERMLSSLDEGLPTASGYDMGHGLGGQKFSGRKLRLFACACFRVLHPNPMNDSEVDKDTIFAAERHADDPRFPLPWLGYWVVSPDVREAAHDAATCTPGPARVAALIRDIAGNPWRPVTLNPAWLTPTVLSLAQAAYDKRPGRECDDAECRGRGKWADAAGDACECGACHGTGRIDDGSLDPVRLAILADALEEAGCDSEDLLAHLRSPGPHVRGCWAVDLVLGKE